ncbi:uncharacterized protein LOC108094550 [Drosophila ficusphila]|uniref:uncharacterized protein LOC108094550 n=1 Tax=Drosophila ficusphila TaxID=30025 RepID=UPI001C89A414|nr:uncharacterized protein LOC108094550 [Drosophila ficusphila]
MKRKTLSKIPILVNKVQMDEQHSSDDDNSEGYDLFMGVWALSVSLGSYNHNVAKSVKYINENNCKSTELYELVYLNDFRIKFEKLQNGTDPEEKVLHETREELFMRLYKELSDLETNENKRCEYLMLFCGLFDSLYPKLNGLKKSFSYRVELINRLQDQAQNILHCLVGNTRSSLESKVRSPDSRIKIYLESKMFEKEEGEIDQRSKKDNCNPIIEINSEKTLTKNMEIETTKIEGHTFIEGCKEMLACPSMGFRFEKAILEITNLNILTKIKGYQIIEGCKGANSCHLRGLRFEKDSSEFSCGKISSDCETFYVSNSDDDSCVIFSDFEESTASASSNVSSYNKNILISSNDLMKTPLYDLDYFSKDYFVKERNIISFINDKTEIDTNNDPMDNYTEISSLDLGNISEPDGCADSMNCNPRKDQTGLSSSSAECSYSLNTFETSISNNSEISTMVTIKHGSDKASKNNCHQYFQLSKLKDLYLEYKKSLETIAGVEEEKSSLIKKNTTENDGLQKNNVSPKEKWEEKELETDEIINQLRQAVSNIKLNLLKDVDKSLELTLQNPFQISLNFDAPKDSKEMNVPNLGKITNTEMDNNLFELPYINQTTEASVIKEIFSRNKANSDTQKKSHGDEPKDFREPLPILIIEVPQESHLAHNNLNNKRALKESKKNFEEEEDQEMLSPILSQIVRTVSDVKINILKEVDKSLSEMTLKNASEIFLSQRCEENPKEKLLSAAEKILLQKISEEYDSEVDSVTEDEELLPEALDSITRESVNPDIKESVQQLKNAEDFKTYMNAQNNIRQHQRHIIAAPRVVIKIFKSNLSYECPPNDPNSPDFYEQLDQFFEIIGQQDCGPVLNAAVSQFRYRLSKAINSIRKQMHRDFELDDWISAVGKCQLRQLLTREENHAYESLRNQLKDKGDQDLSPKSRFTDALHGMMGYESPHLVLSSFSGRLQLRSPQHQESISESFLLVSLGQLGHLHREIQQQLVELGQQGETASSLRKSLQKDLLNFNKFYELQKEKPCSLLCLYHRSRYFKLHFQWLLNILYKIQKGKHIVIVLYDELRRRIGYQRGLVFNWLKTASQPLIIKLRNWLASGQRTSSDSEEYLIKRISTSDIEDFWLKRYRLTDSFSNFFDPQLSEKLIIVGKTLVYSSKYLGITMESVLSSKELHFLLQETFNDFYKYGEQEQLYELVDKLHSEISGTVLKTLRESKLKPEDLFTHLHKYLMLSDIKFLKEFMEIFEPVLDDPASFFDIQKFNQMKNQMSRIPSPGIHIDKDLSEGSKCWNILALRCKLPSYWKALLGQNVKEYEAIFTGLWRFHYVDYVLRKKIVRQQLNFRARIDFKYFEGLKEIDSSFVRLINIFLLVTKGLKNYFLCDLLEPAFERLLLACNQAKTVDDMLSANVSYLNTIRLGSLQSENLVESNQYLEQIYNLILKLARKLEKFFRLTEILLDYVTETRSGNTYFSKSDEYSNRILDFRWTCKTYLDIINELKDQFKSVMVSFLCTLHSREEYMLRSLVERLDPNSYFTKKGEQLS